MGHRLPVTSTQSIPRIVAGRRHDAIHVIWRDRHAMYVLRRFDKKITTVAPRASGLAAIVIGAMHACGDELHSPTLSAVAI